MGTKDRQALLSGRLRLRLRGLQLLAILQAVARRLAGRPRRDHP